MSPKHVRKDSFTVNWICPATILAYWSLWVGLRVNYQSCGSHISQSLPLQNRQFANLLVYSLPRSLTLPPTAKATQVVPDQPVHLGHSYFLIRSPKALGLRRQQTTEYACEWVKKEDFKRFNPYHSTNIWGFGRQFNRRMIAIAAALHWLAERIRSTASCPEPCRSAAQ